jgi:hypothetical protein
MKESWKPACDLHENRMGSHFNSFDNFHLLGKDAARAPAPRPARLAWHADHGADGRAQRLFPG